MPLGEVFLSLNGQNGPIFGHWIKMGDILKNAEGIRKTPEKTWETLTPLSP